MPTFRGDNIFLSLCLLAAASIAEADSWRFEPGERNRVETFGTTKIILTTDARKDRQYPDFILSVYDKGVLQAKYRGISFQHLFASPDHSRFVGLSNDGLPGSAVVVFDNKGRLLLEVKHGLAIFDYCEESVTRVRKWYDANDPNIQFVRNEKYGGYKENHLCLSSPSALGRRLASGCQQ